MSAHEFSVVVIGASAGGVGALQSIVRTLRGDFPWPILIVQHLPPEARVNVNMIFGQFAPGRLFEVEDKMPIRPGNYYFATPDYHLLLERDLTLSLSQDEAVNFSRPSIDVLFESAARALGPAVMGVLMTGANDDGARGLRDIHDLGGVTIVQNPQTAEVSHMPAAALRLFTPTYVADLEDIPQQLLRARSRQGLV